MSYVHEYKRKNNIPNYNSVCVLYLRFRLVKIKNAYVSN